MKKIFFLLTLCVMGLTAHAQSDSTVIKFGYLSYDSVMFAMPEYAEMQTNMAQLREQYAAEQKRVEDDFNKKYEDFLDGQASFPKTILQKRQSELQELLDKNIAFKKESTKLLDDAEAQMIAAMRTSIDVIVSTIAQERGYAFVLNSDKQAVTFINPAMGEELTEVVKQLLNEK
ncbi:MAG: OmpH family outer membrane protein [Prevotella sp.]|nr:OmpH family outer membrane protein [Prevotella sp.]